MDRKKFSIRLIFLIFFILVVNFFATKFHWYYSLWYFDIIMHFLGGFWLGLAGLYIFIPKAKSIGSVIKVLFIVLFVGVGWEVYEMAVNEVLAQNPLNVSDTSSDIFFDLAGGVFAIFYYFKRIMSGNENGVQ